MSTNKKKTPTPQSENNGNGTLVGVLFCLIFMFYGFKSFNFLSIIIFLGIIIYLFNRWHQLKKSYRPAKIAENFEGRRKRIIARQKKESQA